MSANEDVEMRDVEDEEDDEEQVALDLDPDEGSPILLAILVHSLICLSITRTQRRRGRRSRG